MATYQSGNSNLNHGRLIQTEMHLYGCRPGIYIRALVVQTTLPGPAVSAVINGFTCFGKWCSFTTGNKIFEFCNQ
ncbi:MAG: hypothetical protein EAY75_09915 [Bacteroidetes bacterium]|nr:MAG: hypothetical protein EAY75_09915 [Bacteroidota bacterium]